jgi:hypothetical protein
MSKFKVVITVDEQQLYKSRESEGVGDTETLEEAICQEFGWIIESGIHIESIEQIIEE